MLCHNRELFTARVDAVSNVDTHISVEMTMTCFLLLNMSSPSQKKLWTKVDDDCVYIGFSEDDATGLGVLLCH